MTTKEIFEKIAEHQIEGMMLHDSMMNYYMFLGLHDWSKLHKKRFYKESKAYVELNYFFVKHENMLLNKEHTRGQKIIPDTWYRHVRQDVSPSEKRQAVKDGIEKWLAWEKETIKMLTDYHKQLMAGECLVCQQKVEEMIVDVSKEIDMIHKIQLNMMSVDYAMSAIMKDN